MTTVQALLVAILQGLTELFPVSSLGHAVVLPALLGWSLDQRAPEFLPFLVLLHTGTALALLLFFWRDWLALARGVLGIGGSQIVAENRRLFGLIVIATIPAVIVGFVLNHLFRALFASPLVACGFLFLNGVLLLFAEWLRGRVAAEPRAIGAMTPTDAIVIGLWQCGALFPGISRSGATISGALLRGFDHAASARFSFLIALSIIAGATVLEVPRLLHASVPPVAFRRTLIAAVVAGVTAYLAAALLMRWFVNHDRWALNPFGFYCLAIGAIGAAVLLLR